MRRRGFLAAAAGVAAWPLAGRAQHAGKTYRLAVVTQVAPADDPAGALHPIWSALFEELHKLGYAEGRNLSVAWHLSANQGSGVRTLAQEIAGQRPDAIFTPDQRMAGALKAASAAIPIIAILSDPVASGFAATLARPGGNVTGFSIDTGAALWEKRLAMLKEAVPAASRVAWLTPRRNWVGHWKGALDRAARDLGLTIVGAIFDTPVEAPAYRRVLMAAAAEQVDSLSISPALENLIHGRLIADIARQSKLPTVSGYRDNAYAGALMAYGVELTQMFRNAASYIDRILKGVHPGELPVQQPNKVELIINLRTAKAIGISLPETLLARADEVIE